MIKFLQKGKNEIKSLNNKIECDKLKYHLKSENRIPISFNIFNLP